jgi:DNA replication licensing factor MCM2
MTSWKNPSEAANENGANERDAVQENDTVTNALADDAPFSQSVLKKFIRFAKSSYRPEITNIDTDRVIDTYAEVRRLSDQSGGIPIAVRHIESIIRISEAHAKAHLRNMVTDEDMRFGIMMLLESFICSQKHAGALLSQLEQCVLRVLTRSLRHSATQLEAPLQPSLGHQRGQR